MDSTNLCNALRMEFEGVFESKIPLDAFPAKIQDMILALARQENYSIEYMMASLLVADDCSRRPASGRLLGEQPWR